MGGAPLIFVGKRRGYFVGESVLISGEKVVVVDTISYLLETSCLFGDEKVPLLGEKSEIWGRKCHILGENHRLVSQKDRMAWVEKKHSDRGVSSPCYVQGRQPLDDQAAQRHIQPGLESLQGWGLRNLPGQAVPVHHHPRRAKLLPTI